MTDLNSEINNFRFHLRGDNFIKTAKIELASPEETRDFLAKFFLTECVSGVNYSEEDLKNTFEQIQRLMEIGFPIWSEDLPVLPPKTHEQKSLIDVKYYIINEAVQYFKRTSD